VGQEKFTPALVQIAQTPDFIQNLNGDAVDFWIVDSNPAKITAIQQLKKQLTSTKSSLRVQDPIDAANLEKAVKDRHFDLVYIASPNATHAEYIAVLLELADHILVEKPLVDYVTDLVPLEERFSPVELAKIRLMDHYLFKDAVLHFFTHHQRYLKRIEPLERLDFSLIEKNPIRDDRSWLYHTGMIRDLAVHGLSILFKLGESSMLPVEAMDIELKECQKAWYDPIPEEVGAPQETAAAIHYLVGNLPFTIIVGKGAGVSRKCFRLVGEKGELVINILKNTVTLEQDNRSDQLSQAPLPTHGYPEYLNFLTLFFIEPTQIGLAYALAKKQIELFEDTDKISTGSTYPVGTFPFGT
jgi:predicted dehydrogenase